MSTQIKTKLKYILALAAWSFPLCTGAVWSMPSSYGLPQGQIITIVASVMQWILGIVSLVAIIGFAVAGIIYLTSAGDDDRMKNAKNAMVYCIIGVIVGISGYVVILAVSNALNGKKTF